VIVLEKEGSEIISGCVESRLDVCWYLGVGFSYWHLLLVSGWMEY